MNLLQIAKDIVPSHTATFDQQEVGGSPTFVGDVHVALVVMINRSSFIIGGRPLLYVVSPMALTVIMSAAQSAFAAKTDDPDMTLNGVPMIIDSTAENDDIRMVNIAADGQLRTAQIFCANISFF